MMHHVIVEFGKDHTYDFKFHHTELAGTPQDARRWFDEQFVKLGCEFNTPTGKILIIDKILQIAKKVGEDDFAKGEKWVMQFTRNAALALERDVIRIDVSGGTIGY